MMKVLVVLSALLAVAMGESLRGTPQFIGSIENCGGSGDHAQIESLTLTPENPGPGDKYTLVAKYTLDETVTGGHIEYIVSSCCD